LTTTNSLLVMIKKTEYPLTLILSPLKRGEGRVRGQRKKQSVKKFCA